MSTLRAAQIRSKIKENGFRAHHFPRLRRAERGFAFGTVLVSPKSATLTVTIIPVTLAVGVETRGEPLFCVPLCAAHSGPFSDRILGARDLADVMILESGVCRGKRSQWHLGEVSCRWLVFC